MISGIASGGHGCFGVTFLVFGQMVASHERLLTDWTNMVFLARVCSSMSTQFVRTSKGLVAIGPRAGEWFLA